MTALLQSSKGRASKRSIKLHMVRSKSGRFNKRSHIEKTATEVYIKPSTLKRWAKRNRDYIDFLNADWGENNYCKPRNYFKLGVLLGLIVLLGMVIGRSL